MFEFITKLFGGTKSEKDVKDLEPRVVEINEVFEGLQSLSHDQLRQKSADFRQRIKDYTKEIDAEIDSLKAEAEKDEVSFDQKEELYKQIDKLEKDRDDKLEEVLNEILPEAFAVMKETARRFTENETIEVTATDLDKELAAKKDFVTIDGEKATYKTTWLVRGIPVRWKMVH